MLALLAFTIITLTAIDHWTTYLCLRHPVPGFQVHEGNPLAAWLFRQVGLVPGLWIDTAVTALALVFLLSTPRLPTAAKMAFLLVVGAWTVGAVTNNLRAIDTLGLVAVGRSG